MYMFGRCRGVAKKTKLVFNRQIDVESTHRLKTGFGFARGLLGGFLYSGLQGGLNFNVLLLSLGIC
jgi:hypothetical protein